MKIPTFILFLMSCLATHSTPIVDNGGQIRHMVASWEQFDEAGHIAANGKPFNPRAMTCAINGYAFGTKLHVVDVHNGLSCDVIVADRPPSKVKHRIDLSPAAFSKLNGLELGICEVKVSKVVLLSEKTKG